jgi:SAM-dependent methyltransferase
MTPAMPAVDLDYAVGDDIPPGPHSRDSEYLFRRIPELVTAEATRGRPRRVLDVACGLGAQLASLRERCDETWGLDASVALARHCRRRFGAGGPPLVVAVAEALPFRDGSFDSIVCQGSLDHFARPRAFMGEIARVLTPHGRAVIAISNFDSLSCLLGRTLYQLNQGWGRPVYRGRNYWEIPRNHTFKGTYGFLRRLGGPRLELVDCRGISLLWLFRRWTRLVDALPGPIAWSTLHVLDRIAYRVPMLADTLVSVWRPRGRDDAAV